MAFLQTIAPLSVSVAFLGSQTFSVLRGCAVWVGGVAHPDSAIKAINAPDMTILRKKMSPSVI